MKQRSPFPPLETLRAELDYDPHTGTLTYRKTGQAAPGQRVSVAGGRYLSHYVAWILKTGKPARWVIVFRNGNPDDRRWDNLEQKTLQEIMLTRPRQPRPWPEGVSHRDGKWDASVRIAGRRRHLGRFDSPEEAARARAEAKDRLLQGYRRVRARLTGGDDPEPSASLD